MNKVLESIMLLGALAALAALACASSYLLALTMPQ